MCITTLTERGTQVDEHEPGSEACELACRKTVLLDLSIADFDHTAQDDLPRCHGQ